MITVAMLVAFTGYVYAISRWLPVRVTHARGWRRLWPLACVIGMPRISAVVVAAMALRDSGPLQGFGDLALLGLPEIVLISALRLHPVRWLTAACVLLAASSFAWAALVLQIVGRSRNRPAD